MNQINDHYKVQKDGRIFSIKHNWRGYGKRELKTFPNKYGYLLVRFSIDGKRKAHLVHRLVADLYLPPRPTPKHEIRHLDGNKENNDVFNLAWGTAKDNADDREKHGMTSRGLKHSKAIKEGLKRSKCYG